MTATAATEPVAAAEPIAAAKPVAAAEAITATESVATAKVTARTTRLGASAVERSTLWTVDHLQPALRIRQITDDGGALRHLAVPGRLQRGCMAERIAAIVQGYEAIPLSSIEPLHLARRRSLREGLGPFIVIMCHLDRRHTQAG